MVHPHPPDVTGGCDEEGDPGEEITMLRAVAEEILRVAETNGTDMELNEDYVAGYGVKGTTGIYVGKISDFIALACAAAVDSDDPDAIVDAMAGVRHDHLGHGFIFY